jgi:hypothetical protein
MAARLANDANNTKANAFGYLFFVKRGATYITGAPAQNGSTRTASITSQHDLARYIQRCQCGRGTGLALLFVVGPLYSDSILSLLHPSTAKYSLRVYMVNTGCTVQKF